MKIIGVILSGGKSSRMGTDKGLMPFHGKPMIEYSIEFISKFTSKVVISAIDKNYNIYNLPVISDLLSGIGPLGGIYSVMKLEVEEYYFIMPCDMPYASFELAEQMLNLSAGYDIIVPMYRHKPEPLFGIYSRNILPLVEIQIQQKEYKLQELLIACNTYYLEVDSRLSSANPNLFRNINTPKDAQR